MPKPKKTTRVGGTKKAVLKAGAPMRPGFDPAQLKLPKGGGASQRGFGGKQPRFPGRTGGR